MSFILAVAILPLIFWQHGIETAPALKRAGIQKIAVTPAVAAEWRKAGFEIVTITSAQLSKRTPLDSPGIVARADLASPTRSPWVVANGWRFLRQPAGSFVHNILARNRGPLAAAESFAYQADVVLRIDPADVDETGSLLSFLKQIPDVDMKPVADIGVVDDGSQLTGEALNLLSRRNLLFRIVESPSSDYKVNVKPGPEMADPSEFALKIRRQLTDEERSVRVYGSEVVICRLMKNAAGARLHILNYSGREVEGVRVRVKGAYKTLSATAFGPDALTLEDVLIGSDAIEFTLPRIGIYSIVDLKKS
jgi:hypothetical protein